MMLCNLKYSNCNLLDKNGNCKTILSCIHKIRGCSYDFICHLKDGKKCLLDIEHKCIHQDLYDFLNNEKENK